MYGPFQSQQLDLLELELRWESTDVVVHTQVVVFSAAQLAASICAVLMCAHLARRLVQSALRKLVRGASAACNCDPLRTPPRSPAPARTQRRATDARAGELL